jgi:ligand-binding SRPBCC domain-containing protein
MRTYNFEIESTVEASADEVWRHSTNMGRVNLELRPWIRMTYPRQYENLEASPITLGQPLFRSWVLLFRVLPIDTYEVSFLEFETGHRFLERARTLSQRWWQHERTIESSGENARVTDRVEICPRVTWFLPLYSRLLRLVFTNRHRNLRRLFGAATD